VEDERRMKTGIVILLFISVFFYTLVYAAGEKEYVSPDGRYTAYVVTISDGESKVVVTTKNGRSICSKSYASEDGEHGFGVLKAVWTPNSAFFVYSMWSSGGHQPWHCPTDFCSVHDSTIRSLDDYVGPVVSPDVETKPPDIVRGKRIGKSIDDKVDFEVKLSSFGKQGKRK